MYFEAHRKALGTERPTTRLPHRLHSLVVEYDRPHVTTGERDCPSMHGPACHVDCYGVRTVTG
jgi:hypothetical protein